MRHTIAREIYDQLRQDIIRLTIRPGDTLSEAEIAKRFGVSRQPVREAFIHLSDDGFLLVRPQRPTVVKPIAEADVFNAAFIREAIELAVLKEAVARWSDEATRACAALIADQRAAAEDHARERFHELDEAFHFEIADRAGHAHAWAAVDAQKAQMDRVRFLTLPLGSPRAVRDHEAILTALANRDGAAAAAAMRLHLSRIREDFPALRAAHSPYFEAGGEDTPR